MLRFAAIAGTALLLALPATAQQQDNSSQQQQSQSGSQTSQSQQNQNQQKKPEKKKSTAESNPFPEAQSEKAAQQGQPQDQQEPSAPQPSAQKDQDGKKPSAADANPFPEEKSEKAEQQQNQGDQPSQGDDQNYSSSQVQLKGMEPAPSVGDDAAPIQASSPLPYDPKLAKKDAQIGDYYLETGDYKGAYDRYVEAARSDPGNAEAVWGLAESAHRLQMNDVAIKNYRLYLAALPNGPHAKEIRKTLKGMGLEPGS